MDHSTSKDESICALVRQLQHALKSLEDLENLPLYQKWNLSRARLNSRNECMGCLVALLLYLKSVFPPLEDLGSNASIESTSLPLSSPLTLADLQDVERQVILLQQLQARLRTHENKWLSDPAQYIQRPIANTWNVHFNNVGNVSHCKVESFEDHSENQYKGFEGPRR